MRLPDWEKMHFGDGIVREATPHKFDLVLWVPRGNQRGGQHWDRMGNVAGAKVTIEHGLAATPATAVRAFQARGGLLRKLFRRHRQSAERQHWLLPNGQAAQQQGERQTDLLLVWGQDESAPLDEAHVRSRFPHGTRFQQLGKSLFLVAGVAPHEVADKAPLPLEGCPRDQAEQLLAAARKAGDDRRLALAIDDLGVICTRSGQTWRAVKLLEEGLALTAQLGDAALESDLCGNLGLAVLAAKQPARALELLGHALAQARVAGDRFAETRALDRLGKAFVSIAEPHAALAWLGEALALARTLGDRPHEAELLWHLALQHAEARQREQALARGKAAVDLMTQIGNPQAGWFADELRRYRTGQPHGALPQPTPNLSAGTGEEAASNQASSAAPVPPGQVAGPSLRRMVVNATQSMVRFVASGLKTVSAATHRQRLEKCAVCEHHTGLRCRLCGCFTRAKARLPHEQCPLGKWPA